ncbi:MAG TPA: hypothetical protein VKE74_09185, partial [Gemmataceae bacterium]|nr:hypothetical protein [Gemmataceae bacterium]
MPRLVPALVLAALSTVALAQPPVAPGPPGWPFDEITITNGAKFQGLILEERSDGIRFQTVHRPPGRPTVTLTTFFSKSEIASVKRLAEKDRAFLKERLAELDPGGAG